MNVNFNYNNWYLLIINYYYNNYTKSHNNYCRVGVMELCLLNFLILIDCFLCNSYPRVLFESLSFIREIWGIFTSFVFWNFEISKKWAWWLLVQIYIIPRISFRIRRLIDLDVHKETFIKVVYKISVGHL